MDYLFREPVWQPSHVMAEQSDERHIEPQSPVARDAALDAAATPEATLSNAGYLRFIDNVRRAVAIAMAVCGAGVVICAYRIQYLVEELKKDPGVWICWEAVLVVSVLVCPGWCSVSFLNA